MKGAPGFKQWPDPVNGKWKQQLLIWLGSQLHLDTLVETGTCEGSTPIATHSSFKNIYTMELHPLLYEVSNLRLHELTNVHLYHGSSPDVLETLFNSNLIPERTLFWLDAHSSGPHTAPDTPLPREIKVITERCRSPLMVVDDEMSTDNVKEIVANLNSPKNWAVSYLTGEVVLYPEGDYTIPPFDTI